MPRTLPLLLTVASLYAPEALAQDTLASGASFKVKDISTADGYYAQRGNLVGLTCTASGAMTRVAGTHWFGGPASCNGATYYFFQVEPEIQAAAGYGSATVTAMAAGTPFIVRDISSGDAYFSTKGTIVGLSCIADAGMSRSDGQWWSGPAKCNGNSFYFYQMAFDVTGAAPVAPPPVSGTFGSATAADTLYAGSSLILRDIHADDLYAPQKASMIGTTCTVADNVHRNDGMWYGGDANCNGTYYYFYKMAFDVVGTPVTTAPVAAAPAGSYGSVSAPDTLPAGTSFVIADISPDDAYYSSKGEMIGLSCTVSGDIHRNDGMWYGGGADCSNGSDYYFYKMAFNLGAGGPLGTAGSSGGGGSSDTAPDTLPEGSRFTIRDIAPDDAYYGSHAGMLGVSCTVASSTLTRTDGKWYGGDANCDNGSYYYFYKMAFDMGAGGSGGGGVGGRYSGYYVPKKSSVVIADVSSEDAFYAYKAGLVGQSCKVVKGDLTTTGDGWFGGTLKCGGTSLYFYQVGVYYYP